MDRVNGRTVAECVHHIPLTEPCTDCKNWRAGDAPAGAIESDGPEVTRFRDVSRETSHASTTYLDQGSVVDLTFRSVVPNCPFFLGTGKCETGCQGPDGPACWEPANDQPLSTLVPDAEPFAELGVWTPSAADYRRWEHEGLPARHRDWWGRHEDDWFGHEGPDGDNY